MTTTELDVSKKMNFVRKSLVDLEEAIFEQTLAIFSQVNKGDEDLREARATIASMEKETLDLLAGRDRMIQQLIYERDSLKNELKKEQVALRCALADLRREQHEKKSALDGVDRLRKRINTAQELLYQAIRDGDVGSSQLKEIADILQGSPPEST